jgi:hypothetical protein
MGGCAGQAKNPKEISVYNAQKEAPKVGNDANITNLVENSTEILVNKDNDINPARLPVPDYRFNKNLAATILKSEDLVPKL